MNSCFHSMSLLCPKSFAEIEINLLTVLNINMNYYFIQYNFIFEGALFDQKLHLLDPDHDLSAASLDAVF